MRFEILRRMSELDEAERNWNELVSDSLQDTPFLQWEWCSTWWRHYGQGHDLAIVVALDEDRWMGLAPLYVDRNGGWRGHELRFLGTGEVCSEYLGFVLRKGYESEVSRALIERVVRDDFPSWRIWRVTELPVMGAVPPILDSFLRANGI